MSALPGESLTGYVAAARAGSVRAADAVEACVGRIRAWQPRINAFVRLHHDAPQGRGRLEGAPLAHKDMVYRAGEVSACGSRIREGWIADRTAAALERLDAAGATDLGTLNMTEFAYGPTGQNEHWGDVRNPWHLDHITGGSSSGSAAAVAARLVYGALGSDTGGSIRLPSSCCGVTGLKPTWGRVSRYAAMPLAHSLDTLGPIAQSAADCAVLMEALAGRDDRDPESASTPAGDYVAALERAREFRIAYAPSLAEQADPDVAVAVREALHALARAGAKVEESAAPDVDRLSSHCMVIMQVEASSLHGRWMRERADDYESGTRARLQAGYAIPATLYVDSLRHRGQALRAFLDRVLGACDVFALPTVPVRVPTLAETAPGGGPNMAKVLGDLTRFTRWVNYLGLPAITIPCGVDRRGLPVGLQLVARPFDEATLLALGHAYQSITDWHRRVPSLS